MRYRLLQAPLLVALIAAASATASATPTPFELDKITRGTQDYVAVVSYEKGEAYAGNSTLEVTVSLQTRGTVNLEIMKFEPADQAQISFKELSRVPSRDPTGLRTIEYKFHAGIPADLEPKRYPITIVFGHPGEKNDNRTFLLFVGVRNKGKLSVVDDGLSITEFYTGTVNSFPIELENKFIEYPAIIRSVTIKSSPLGLVQSTTVPITGVSINPLQRGVIEVDLKAAPLSFSNLLSGFSDSNRLIVHITYDDGHGRTITDLVQPVKLKVKPRDRVLIVAMLLGVIIGAILKCGLQSAQQKGLIGPREALIAVGITSLIGLFVAFVAVVGRIKIIAFDTLNSYDNPAVIAIISAAGAFCGAQFLSTLFKSSNPGSAGSQASAGSPASSPTATANPIAKLIS